MRIVTAGRCRRGCREYVRLARTLRVHRHWRVTLGRYDPPSVSVFIDVQGFPMTRHVYFPRRVAIVLGCGDVGSAVALALHQAGLAVVLAGRGRSVLASAGDARSPTRGTSAMRTSGARGRASVRRSRAFPSILARRHDCGDDLVVAGRRDRPGAGNTSSTHAEAAPRRRGAARARFRSPVGIGSGFASGENVDLAIESARESARE